MHNQLFFTLKVQQAMIDICEECRALSLVVFGLLWLHMAIFALTDFVVDDKM